MRNKHLQKPFAFAATILVLSACAGTELQSEHRVVRQDEAGSVHFAVVSVAPWETYAESLRPGFSITPEEALRKVVPSTRTISESVIDSLQAAAAVSGTTEGGASDPESQARTNQRQVSAPQIINEASGKGEGIDLDPMLQYQAATALYQEIQLLNGYIEHAAIDRGYQAYVVRLNISLVPTARNEPYDAYVTLAFFSDPGAEDGMRKRDLPIGDLLDDVTSRNTPKVVPLLVTDNLEGTLHSRSVENVRQFAGALSFMSNFIGGAGSIQSVKDELSSVFGSDLNSLLTVSRVCDNTIRVRLGALQQATSSYAMIPRNHAITVLVMVPETADREVEVVSATTLVDAETGVALPERPDKWLSTELEGVAQKYGLNVPGARLMELMSIVQANDEALYRTKLSEILGEQNAGLAFARPFWVELASLLIGSRYAKSRFDLPEAPDITDPLDQPDEDMMFRPQDAIVTDDGRTRSVIVLRGGHISRPSELDATLTIRTKDRDANLIAESVSLRDATEAHFTFPSLAALGLKNIPPGGMTLSVDYGTWTEEFNVHYQRR